MLCIMMKKENRVLVGSITQVLSTSSVLRLLYALMRQGDDVGSAQQRVYFVGSSQTANGRHCLAAMWVATCHYSHSTTPERN